MASCWFGFASHPRGLRTLFFAELWERFSYYGMRAELVLFLTASAAEGGLGLTLGTAGLLYGNWAMAVYLLAIPGGSIADLYLGARRAALAGGTLIACGHLTLAVPSVASLPIGLALIACGTGLFKPSISTLVGALYRPDDMRRDAGFLIFYAGINLGAVAAPLVTGVLSQSAWFKAWLAARGFDPARSWHWGFAAAGLGMLVSLVVLARAKSSVPTPTILVRQSSRFSRGGEMALTVAGTLALLVLLILSDLPSLAWLRVLFVAVPVVAIALFAQSRTIAARRMAVAFVLFVAATLFTAITEQAAVSIALFADRLTRSEIWNVAFPSMWFQSLNPLFVIVLGPAVAAAWTGLGTRQPSAVGKFAIALTLLAASYGVMVVAVHFAVSSKVGPGWLVGLFLLQALAELCVGPVGLSTMTKLAPAGRTALMLGIWFLAAAFGSKLAGILGSRLTPDAPAQFSRFFLEQVLLLLGASAVLATLNPWMRRLTAPWPADRDPDADRHAVPRTMHPGSPTSEYPSRPAPSGLKVPSRGQSAPRAPPS